MFELKERDYLGRICKLKTNHGTIETPALLPVINPKNLIITPKEMKKIGYEGIITNAYILYKDGDLKDRALKYGIHNTLDFDGIIVSDSGTFQIYSYGGEIQQEEIINFQKKIGVDIGTMLDIITSPDESYETANSEVKENLDRAKKACESKGNMPIICTVQGSVYPELRKFSADEISKLSCDVQAIGGVVRLMESYRFKELIEVIISSKLHLNHGKPVHLFGAGHPMLFPIAVLLGCDLFDSSSYAKYAMDNRFLFRDCTRHIEEMEYSPCSCNVCSKHKIKEILEMPDKERTKKIAEHNLYESLAEIRNVKEAIHAGRLWELAEQRAYSNPYLLEGFRVLRKYVSQLERFASISKKSAFLYTGIETNYRPEVYRYNSRLLSNYIQPEHEVIVCLPDGKKQYSKHYEEIIKRVREICDAHFVVTSFFGPVPIELDEVYPILQSIIPDTLEKETEERIVKAMENFSHTLVYPFSIVWDEGALDILKSIATKNDKPWDIDLMRVKATMDLQFGKGASEILDEGNIKIIKSKKTGKIRNVFLAEKHILSMRAHDGFFTLKIEGARLLHKKFKKPNLRVIVSNEVSMFIREGKNVFSKFIIDADEKIRPMDEVLITNEEDELLGVGRTLMNREELLSFKKGIGVKVREGTKKQ
ncbi:MAG: tRNA guanosine(15) transglycosylase TgtA [Candidatus Thermoplasmatota archaeon]